MRKRLLHKMVNLWLLNATPPSSHNLAICNFCEKLWWQRTPHRVSVLRFQQYYCFSHARNKRQQELWCLPSFGCAAGSTENFSILSLETQYCFEDGHLLAEAQPQYSLLSLALYVLNDTSLKRRPAWSNSSDQHTHLVLYMTLLICVLGMDLLVKEVMWGLETASKTILNITISNVDCGHVQDRLWSKFMGPPTPCSPR